MSGKRRDCREDGSATSSPRMVERSSGSMRHSGKPRAGSVGTSPQWQSASPLPQLYRGNTCALTVNNPERVGFPVAILAREDDRDCWQKTDDAELPHLAAPAVDISVISDGSLGILGSYPGVDVCSGTSFSAPQVSGAVASLQGYYFGLRSWPEGVVPIMLVSSWTSFEPGGPDGDILNLDDGIDDKDGAGELNGYEAWQVAEHRQNAGNAVSRRGFDYRYDYPGDWAQYSMSPIYYASLPADGYLRVATVMMNHPSCNTPGTCDSAADNFSEYYLYVYDRATGDYYWSVGLGNNYKYLAIHSAYSTTQTYEISAWMADWKGMSGDTWGLAWDTD